MTLTDPADAPIALPAGYRYVEVIAHRVLSTIVKATRPDGTEVAVKLAPVRHDPQRSAPPELVARVLENERDVLRRLDHPNIVRLIDVRPAPVLVLEYLPGATLVDAPVAPESALRDAADVARALAHAHRRGVVHCDVNPTNVVLDAAGSLRLIDFGIAVAGESPVRDVRRDPSMGGFAGSPSFVAPEQVRNEALSGATDLYSLGVTLFYWLTGTTPYPVESDRQAACRHHLETPPESLRDRAPDLPVEVADVVAGLLAKNPRDRPHDAAAVASVLRRLAGSLTTPRFAPAPANPPV